MKFQFREMDTLIHPKHHKDSDNKHIPRFLATRLYREQYQLFFDAAREEGMLTMCTPFDEESVDVITDMGFDIIKVASCSATDWPLLEKVADSGIPLIFSTGGVTIKGIDDLCSFFEHRGVDFAVMHCVSIYPITDEHFQLNQIDLLRNRYPQRVIGWSTHEDPDAVAPVYMAVAKGARMFERHVGVTTDEITLNGYSSTPEQLDAWITAYKHAKVMAGDEDGRPESAEIERASLDTLRRGVFAKKAIKKGTVIDREQVFFAMPYEEGQLDSSQWRDGIVVKQDVKVNATVMANKVDVPHEEDFQVIKTAIHDVKALLNEARVVLNSEFEVEYSHHYGVENFREVGAVIINCINREYCKKIIVQLPDQKHPMHFHARKEETFQVLYGELHVDVDGHKKVVYPGETCLVLPGIWHSFTTETGCVFEEISTTHYNDDSFYKDKKINKMKRSDRKTLVDHWGRYQLSDSDLVMEEEPTVPPE